MFQVWWAAARPKTLPASVSPILLGSALAFYDGDFKWVIFVLAMLCAIALQIAVNFANDWSDAKSGVDTDARLGPQRVMHQGLVTDRQMKIAMLMVALFALVTGLALIWLSHWSLLLFGLLSLLAVFAYSGGPYPLASHGLGEFTVFLFFGLLAVAGTYFAHTLQVSLAALGYATAAGLISAAIMLVNNLRDIETDTPAGKRTLAVRLGDQSTRRLYRGLLIAALIVHLVVSFPLSVWGVLPAILIAPMVRRRIQDGLTLQGRTLNTLLANTAKLELMYCLLASATLIALRWF